MQRTKKTARKGSKTRKTTNQGGARRGIGPTLQGYESRQMTERVLPFDIHDSGTLSPTWDREHPPLEVYEWSAAEAAVADAALMRGYQLSIPVRGDCIAAAVWRIVRRLKSPAHVWYSDRQGRLLLQVMEDDRVPEDDDETDDCQ